jgi:integrase
MAKINYTLSKKVKDGMSEIILDVQPKRGIHYRVKSGIYITPINYDRLTATDKLLTYDRLYDIEKAILNELPESKDACEKIIRRIQGTDENLLSVFSEYADARMIEKGLTDGTREVYKSLKALLKAYSPDISMKQIDDKWMQGLILHMCSEGMTNRTQSNYYRVLKTFFNSCDISLNFTPKFKVVENDVVYLTAAELHNIYTVKLKIDNRDKKYSENVMSAVRDIFVVQCLTGLRYSDMVHIYKDNIQEDEDGKYIVLITKKTMKRLKIYFNDRAQHILEQWDWTLPHYKLEVMNRWLPEIAKQAGVKGRVEVVRMVGSKRVVEHKEKWEMVKTHTARRTFITLMLEGGENITTIRSITGHTQLSSFSRYVAVSDTKKAKAVKGLDW